jgi:hypothetical protein
MRVVALIKRGGTRACARTSSSKSNPRKKATDETLPITSYLLFSRVVDGTMALAWAALDIANPSLT